MGKLGRRPVAVVHSTGAHLFFFFFLLGCIRALVTGTAFTGALRSQRWADCFEPPTLFAGSASELNAVESTRAPQKFAVQYCQRQSSAPLNPPAELECRALRGAMKVHCQTATLRPGRNANDTK